MGFFARKTTPSLSEDLVQRVWDVNGRLKQLEDRLDGALDELSKRYRRAEQSEKRLTDKQARPPTGDETAHSSDAGPNAAAFQALRDRALQTGSANANASAQSRPASPNDTEIHRGDISANGQ